MLTLNAEKIESGSDNDGAVAQMVERYVRNVEVRGSTPLSSIFHPSNDEPLIGCYV